MLTDVINIDFYLTDEPNIRCCAIVDVKRTVHQHFIYKSSRKPMGHNYAMLTSNTL
jgi:hypothetical protein